MPNRKEIDLKFKRVPKNLLYNVWYAMINRTTNPENKDYLLYSKKGVSNEWKVFENFINDMSPTYVKGLTLERIDNSKGYSKDNCRWTDWSGQQQNTSKTIRVKVRGEIMSLRKAIRVMNCIPYGTVYKRMKAHGRSFEDAIIKDKHK